MVSNLCSKKWEKKIIATKDYSITCRPNILQQLLHQNYTGTDIRLRHWGMSWWSVKVNCTLAYTQGCLRGMCPLRSWKFCIFETEIVHYGDISANLDQAMSKKKKKKTQNTCKKQTNKQTHTHTHTHTHPPHTHTHTHTHRSLGLSGPNFAFGRNFW